MKKSKIKIIKDGPYLVSGKISLDEQIIGVNKEEDPQKNVSGPLWVKGSISIESSDGFEYEKKKSLYTMSLR